MSTSSISNTAFLLNPVLQQRIRNSSRGDKDTAQAIALKLLELAHQDRRFAQQEIGFHIRRAKWEARHIREKAVTYDRYLACEPYCVDVDGDEVSVFDEYIPSDDLTPEQVLIERETLAECRASFIALRQAIPTLTSKQRTVAELLLAGQRPSKIADQTGMSRSLVSHYIGRIRRSLALAKVA